MKLRSLFLVIASLVALSQAVTAETSASLITGIWENGSRFAEFSPDGRLRLVLKPYYGFVYEDTGWIPYTLEPSDRPDVCRLAVRQSGEKSDQLVPAAVLGDGLFLSFFRRLDDAGDAVTTPSASAGPALSPGLLSGFWMACGNADALRLYRSEPVSEFFCYYFTGNRYCRIRYWADDVRWKDVRAEFEAAPGEQASVPKFIRTGGILYTCVTSTGHVLRNFERGSYVLEGGTVLFVPEAVAYAGTAAAVAKPLPARISADGNLLAFGEPYLSRSKLTGLDAEIAAHNGLRRPPRKPVFGYMDLDFRWDEIDRIRNNGSPPAGQ